MFAHLEFRHRVDFHCVHDFLMTIVHVTWFAQFKTAFLDKVDALRFVTDGENRLTTIKMHQFEMVKQAFQLVLGHLRQNSELL